MERELRMPLLIAPPYGDPSVPPSPPTDWLPDSVQWLMVIVDWNSFATPPPWPWPLKRPIARLSRTIQSGSVVTETRLWTPPPAPMLKPPEVVPAPATAWLSAMVLPAIPAVTPDFNPMPPPPATVKKKGLATRLPATT